MQIRDAQEQDLAAIVEIYNETVPSRMVTADTEPVSVESRLQWFQNHSPNGFPLWVLAENNSIIGWLSFSAFYGRPAYQHTTELSVYISHSARGKGYGRLLLQEALNRASSLGFRTLLGFIFGHNTPSLYLFQKLGFQEWGRLPAVAKLDGIERDVIIVGRKLTDSD